MSDFGGRISTRDLNLGIPSNAAAQAHVIETHGWDSRKAAALRFLHQKWVQTVLCCLLILDVLILFTELILLSAFPVCEIIVRDCIACCSATEDSHGGERWLAGEHDEICDAGYHETGQASCDGHKWHAVHTAEEVLFWITITILTIFFAELMVEIWSLTPCIFFRQAFYAIDFFVITVSLILELVFHFHAREYAEELIGFIIIFRLWRFVRIGHGIVEVTAELGHQHYEELLKFASDCEDVINEANLKMPSTTKRVLEMIEEAEEEREEMNEE